MESTFYKSKIDWWLPLIVIVTASAAVMGPMIDGEAFLVGLIVGIALCIMEIVMFASVKYQICGGKLGVRNIFYRWEWFPIDKISVIKKSIGILSAPALSTKRLSIKFSDKKILKSSMPLEISPKDQDAFIARLREINPDIEVL